MKIEFLDEANTFWAAYQLYFGCILATQSKAEVIMTILGISKIGIYGWFPAIPVTQIYSLLNFSSRDLCRSSQEVVAGSSLVHRAY